MRLTHQNVQLRQTCHGGCQAVGRAKGCYTRQVCGPSPVPIPGRLGRTGCTAAMDMSVHRHVPGPDPARHCGLRLATLESARHAHCTATNTRFRFVMSGGHVSRAGWLAVHHPQLWSDGPPTPGPSVQHLELPAASPHLAAHQLLGLAYLYKLTFTHRLACRARFLVSFHSRLFPLLIQPWPPVYLTFPVPLSLWCGYTPWSSRPYCSHPILAGHRSHAASL